MNQKPKSRDGLIFSILIVIVAALMFAIFIIGIMVDKNYKKAYNEEGYKRCDKKVNEFLGLITEEPGTECFADSVSKYYYEEQLYIK